MPDDDLAPWTPDGAARLRAAAAELVAAVTAHADAVTAVAGDAGMPAVLAAGDRLLPAVLAYADAQFDLTGNDFPFGVLHSYADDDEPDDDGPDDEPDDDQPSAEDRPEGTTEVAVLQRLDLRVTDQAAVLAAGRRAHLCTTPDGGEGEAPDGTDLGRALSQLASADGWDSLGDVPGLRSTGRSVLVVGREVAPGEDPDGADDESGELLYSQQDVFPG